MRKKLLFPLALAAVALTACMDENYDLGNVDTTARIEVKDFSLPLNVDEIKLDSILDINPGDEIKKMPNGEYAVVKEGTFETDHINVNPFVISRPNVGLIHDVVPVSIDIPEDVMTFISKPEVKEILKNEFHHDELTLKDILDASTNETVKASLLPLGITVPELKSDHVLLSFVIPEEASQQVSMNTAGIDKNIKSIKSIGIKPETVTVNLKVDGLQGIVENFQVKDLKVCLPSGFISANSEYNKGNGEWKPAITSVKPEVGIDLTLTLNGLDFTEAGDSFKYSESADGTHAISYDKNCSASGSVDLTVADVNQDLTISAINALQNVTYSCSVKFSDDIVIEKFNGHITYSVDDVSVDPVNLTNLPGFLQQTGTKLVMQNPQIYLAVNNPLSSYISNPIEASLVLSPEPGATETFKTDIVLPRDEANVTYCYSPNAMTDFFGVKEGATYDYSNATWKEFKNLGRILASTVNGENVLPKTVGIGVNVKDIDTELTDFVLTDHGSIQGNYAFVAPLQLTSESHIAYADTINGWYSDDLAHLTIEKAKVLASVTSDFQVENLILTLYPVTMEPTYGAGLQPVIGSEPVGTVTLAANAKGTATPFNRAPLDVDIIGPITRLDGIYVKVNVKSLGEAPLRQDNTVKLENLKVTVSGYYEKEL